MSNELPPEIVEKLAPALDAIREEIREAVLFSPLPGGGQRIDRAGIAVARYNDGGALSYQQSLTRIMDRVVGRGTLKKMRAARRQHRRETGQVMIPDLVNSGNDNSNWVDRDPDLIDQGGPR